MGRTAPSAAGDGPGSGWRARGHDRGQHRPAHVLAGDDDAVVAQQRRAAGAQGRCHARAARGVGDQLGPSSKSPRPSAKSTASCVSMSSCGVGRAQGGGVEGVAVDDRVDVGRGAVDLGVHDRSRGGTRVTSQRVGVIEVERDDVLGLDLVERGALALDPDGARARLAGADVARASGRRSPRGR